MRQGRLWLVVASLGACGDPAGDRGFDPEGPGGKADDAAAGLEDVPHQMAVQICEDRAKAARVRAPENDPVAELQIEIDRRDCLVAVNEAVLPVLEDALGSVDLDVEVAAATAMADTRASAVWLCGGFVAAADVPPGPEADMAVVRCEGHMERFMADLIDRHVDLGVEPYHIGQAWRRYGACYDTVHEIPTDDPQTALQEQIDSYRRLAECIHAVDRELSDELGTRVATAYDDDPAHVGELFATELDNHTGWTLQFCTVLAAASADAHEDAFELQQLTCTSTALELRGRLLGTITGLEPDDTVPGDPEEPPEPEEPGDPVPPDPVPDDPTPMPTAGEACYPGASGDWSTCLPVVPIEDVEEGGYVYPAGFGGNPNYRQPVAVIDLDAVDPLTQLSPDFTLGELAHRHKGRYAIVQPHAVASLQALRDEIGAISVNSGYRSPDYNASVGGAGLSRHMYGDGFDLDPLDVGLSTAESACVSLGGKLVEYDSHVHCDFRFDDPDEAFFGAL